jgi:hypothetical protein
VRSYCAFTGGSYTRVSACLELDVLYEPGRPPPTDEFLRRTLDPAERERNVSLQRLRAFQTRRVRARARGTRQLSAAERTALCELTGGIG